MNRKEINAAKLVEELQKRKVEIYNDTSSPTLLAKESIKTGFVMGLNDAITIINKLREAE